MRRALTIGTLLLLGLAVPGWAGLFHTDAEVANWQERAVNGPYKTAGDEQTNSPGDWDRIVANKDSFNATPNQDRWAGNTLASTCWDPVTHNPIPSRTDGEPLKDAALWALMQNNATTRTNVVNELLAQAATAGTDWGDGARWCRPFEVGAAHSWEISMWLKKLLLGYSYIRDTIDSDDRDTLDAWFLASAELFEEAAHGMTKTRFPNRKSDDYATFGAGFSATDCDNGSTFLTLYHGGPEKAGFHGAWHNRGWNHVTLFGLVGVLLDNATLKVEAKRWFEEWLTYAVWANGADQDLHRRLDNNPDLGWHYSGSSLATAVMLADAFARDGDASLYDFSTTDGNCIGDQDTSTSGNFGTSPKTLKSAVLFWIRMVDGTNTVYAPGHDGDSDYAINSVDPITGTARIHDTWMATGNLFWQDSEISALYTRTAVGAPDYPANPATGGWGVWGGEWGLWPGKLFLHGQLEGAVDPYTQDPGPPVQQITGLSAVSVSETLDPNHAIDNLFDACTASGPAQQCSVGGEVPSFQVVIDLGGATHDLARLQLYGDDVGTWTCATWDAEYTVDDPGTGPWTSLFTGANCTGEQYWTQNVGPVDARYVRLSIVGTASGTEVREFQAFATPAPTAGLRGSLVGSFP